MPSADDAADAEPVTGPLPPPPVAWLAPWFAPPTRTELVTGHHLRPLRAGDVGLPGLPPGLDPEACAVAGLARTRFVYGAFDDEERRLLAWVTLDPGAAPHDVQVGWSLAPEEVGGGLGDVLSAALPDWLGRAWPWTSPLVVRR